VAPPDEELLLEDELLEDPELLELPELLEDDELVEDPEPLELEDEGALEPLLEEPPPHPARTVANSKLPRSAVLDALELPHAPRLTALGRVFSESGTTAVDMVRAPIKYLVPWAVRSSPVAEQKRRHAGLLLGKA